MKKIVVLNAALAFIAALFILNLDIPTPVAASVSTLCSATEKVIFSCNTGKKTVSVCHSETSGDVTYRFGKPGNVPGIVRSSNSPQIQVVRGKTAFSGGGGAYIAFIDGNMRYVVHDYIGKWGEDIGVDVERNGESLSSIYCIGLPVGSLENDIPTIIPIDPESMRQ